jgi:hypothetical protein
MEDDKHQKELFELDRPKKSFFRLAGILPKPNIEGKFLFTLPFERTVFLAIGFLMLLVLTYALGVERGKTIAFTTGGIVEKQIVSVKALPVIQAQKTSQFMSTAPIAKDRVLLSQKAIAMTLSSLPVTKSVTDAAKKEAPISCVIIAVTFSKQQSANEEAGILRSEGFNASVVYDKPYYQVCVGPYPDKSAASTLSDLKKIRKKYKDAYFKLR